MVIAIDNREPIELVDEIRKFKVDVDYRFLEVGDILIGDQEAWERKTMEDFVGSLHKGKIWEQIRNIKDEYENPGLILEGRLPSEVPRAAYIMRKRIRMTLASIRKDWGIPIDYTENIKDTAMFLVSYYSRIGREKRKYYRPVKKQKTDPFDIASDVLCALPGIGRVKVDELMLTYGSVKDITALSAKELAKIRGISMDKANEIYVILNTEFRSK